MSFFLRKIPTLHDPINQKEVASVESLTTRTIDGTQLSILRFITQFGYYPNYIMGFYIITSLF